MSIIYVLIPIAILLTTVAIYLFFWAVKTDQFEDLEKQGLSILFDEDTKDSDKGTFENEEAENTNINKEKENIEKKVNIEKNT